MFYDLNVPYSTHFDTRLPTVLKELGFDVVVLSTILQGTLSSNITCSIPDNAISPASKIKVLTRCTVIYEDTSQNCQLNALTKAYDVVAIRPTNEKTFQQACTSLDIDLISMDFSQRMPFYYKRSTVAAAIARGIRFEISYASCVRDATSRKMVFSNATQLVRAARGKGIIISSEAKRAFDIRAPYDLINLSTIWGIKQEYAQRAVSEESRAVLALAYNRRKIYRSVVEVVEDTGPKRKSAEGGQEKPKAKRAKAK